jgi:hypothetical protein
MLEGSRALALYTSRAVANGLRTDHPVPGLPFADDSHIPVEDSAAIEAIGRHPGGETWGRDDPARPRGRGGWVAYTTDPGRHDLAWVVRWHPEHGRSVVLYRNDEAVSAYMDYVDGPLLFRSGGYWWDGTTWYRPSQVIDWPGEDYYRRPVPGAATVTAAGILAAGPADPGRGTVLDVAGIDPDAPYEGRWNDDLALWAARRGGQGLDRCVVSLTAPELAAENLIGAPGLAEITGIGPSTLRAYITRGEAGVPLPQAIIGARPLWARPVAEEWAEQRQRDPRAVDAAVSVPGHYGDPVPAGQAQLASLLARSFLADMWDYRPFRGRWALRWRSKDHVREVADALGHEAASYVVRTFIPADALSATLQHALLDDLADSQRSHRATTTADSTLRLAGPDDTADETPPHYGIMPKIAKMLGWLARHRPATAAHVITSVTGEAERRLGIPRHVTERTIRVALDLDGDMGDTLDEFLRRVMTPAADSQDH